MNEEMRAAKKPLKIEVGKHYVTCNGAIVGPMERSDDLIYVWTDSQAINIRCFS